MKGMLISLHPKWCDLILNGKKTIEVRRRVPHLDVPFTMYMYCTKPNTKDPFELLEIHDHETGRIHKGNGKVCGEVTCVGIEEVFPPYRDKLDGTCLTGKELYTYVGMSEKIYFMRLENPIIYSVPKSLAEFNQTIPPQSWRYVEV